MARVKLRCIIGCPGLKSSYREKGLFHKILYSSIFQHANVISLHKKRNKSLKENYRPISILPILSKVFERSMFKQMSSFFDDIF